MTCSSEGSLRKPLPLKELIAGIYFGQVNTPLRSPVWKLIVSRWQLPNSKGKRTVPAAPSRAVREAAGNNRVAIAVEAKAGKALAETSRRVRPAKLGARAAGEVKP